MFRKMLLSVLGFLVLSVCVISGVDAGTYDGEWKGKTNQGFDVSFTVSNDIIKSFVIKYELKGSKCSSTSTNTVSGMGISGNTFTYGGGLLLYYDSTIFKGIFSNNETCTGTWSGKDSNCNASGSGTWEATNTTPQAVTATECIPVGNDLLVNIPCAEYDAHKYAFTLKSYINADDPFGLYWMMDIPTFTELQGYTGSCLNVKSDLALNMCAKYGGVNYGFTLDFYQMPQHSDGLYWKMNLSTFKAQ